MSIDTVTAFLMIDDGTIPNNPRLPVLVYRQVLRGGSAAAKRLFNSNGWLNSWVNGVFDYHHYHSNAHEVLGVSEGYAELLIGGENGRLMHVRAGDVLVLPAGTGHKRLSSGGGFKVVGAYPDGMSYNTRTGRPTERLSDLEAIAKVPLPSRDPVYGDGGPLADSWLA